MIVAEQEFQQFFIEGMNSRFLIADNQQALAGIDAVNEQIHDGKGFAGTRWPL